MHFSSLHFSWIAPSLLVEWADCLFPPRVDNEFQEVGMLALCTTDSQRLPTSPAQRRHSENIYWMHYGAMYAYNLYIVYSYVVLVLKLWLKKNI
jgi:hypothetical protein